MTVIHLESSSRVGTDPGDQLVHQATLFLREPEAVIMDVFHVAATGGPSGVICIVEQDISRSTAQTIEVDDPELVEQFMQQPVVDFRPFTVSFNRVDTEVVPYRPPAIQIQPYIAPGVSSLDDEQLLDSHSVLEASFRHQFIQPFDIVMNPVLRRLDGLSGVVGKGQRVVCALIEVETERVSLDPNCNGVVVF